ncbi:unnamed protein product [Darwinula stevensoni]|uniref:Uncharacterized protein n=1 Tax=Darwinula stevensoni TaxID=69355 RepID=A0A7R8X3N8_9CRUS|nr:unnamed protein product [Darwinula stevensoni]CAG0885162.1 unnamed protein product [Darwinula stevensoni]
MKFLVLFWLLVATDSLPAKRDWKGDEETPSRREAGSLMDVAESGKKVAESREDVAFDRGLLFTFFRTQAEGELDRRIHKRNLRPILLGGRLEEKRGSSGRAEQVLHRHGVEEERGECPGVAMSDF